MPRLKFVLSCHLEEVKCNRIASHLQKAHRTHGGIGIGKTFAAECGIKRKFVMEWWNGRPRKTSA